MEKKNYTKTKAIRLIAAVIFAITLILGLTSCYNTDNSYAADYLVEHGVPEFDKSKFRGIEVVYRDYYVEDIPEAEAIAERTASVYFEKYHEIIDTGDKSVVTSALIASYTEAIGDKYSVYRSAEEYEEYDTDMSGSFYGIGISVEYSYIEGTMTVTEVYENSGAADAGIAVGDRIVKVNGSPLEEIGYQGAVNTIRGELDTTVEITVSRDGEEITVTATRKKVVEKTVTYSIDENKIGYIKISSFKSNTFSQFKLAIDYMKDNNAIGIVYDLRSNPGGYLSAVEKVLKYIAPKGTTIVSFTNNYGKATVDKDSNSFALPSVVICNGSTASAGELFTAAMRDFDEELGFFEVTIVGETTYGKGVMQSTYTFTDNSAITLTVAYYNPPSGENYDGVGIEPDISVALSDEGDIQLDTAYAEIYKLIN